MADHDLYSGLIRLHVLYHASEGPLFGFGMIQELRRHGYRVGPGTLHPALHRMEQKGYLRSRRQVVSGKIRRVYDITPAAAPSSARPPKKYASFTRKWSKARANPPRPTRL